MVTNHHPKSAPQDGSQIRCIIATSSKALWDVFSLNYHQSQIQVPFPSVTGRKVFVCLFVSRLLEEEWNKG